MNENYDYGEPTICEKCGGYRGRARYGLCEYGLDGNWKCIEDRDVDAEREARSEKP